MNREDVDALLRQIREPGEEFTVVFSGKRSRKVNGLYKPETREILIHNRNFAGDGELVYTAIHEYAHHLQFTSATVPVSTRSHTTAFWALFHSLLERAQELDLYVNPFDSIPEFRELTGRIKDRFVQVNGELMKELGSLLIHAQQLCDKHGASFGDYLDRVVGLPRTGATQMMRAHTMDLDPRIGFDNMRTVGAISSAARRTLAQEALLDGKSPDTVKFRYATSGGGQAVSDDSLGTAAPPAARVDILKREKASLERQIKRLEAKVVEIDRRMERARSEDS